MLARRKKLPFWQNFCKKEAIFDIFDKRKQQVGTFKLLATATTIQTQIPQKS